ncbi:hypothetical protein HAX54_006427 [Datura stramonium]|uniref:Disease resistance R13L4/SHOC-2-like LRR domain-containing protein n=1 Tax=Datura stramonium TaxID=4076 RepID=A0ABS8TAB1_DATST|nr:hypothetical protein [Datura stramonium]
MNDIVYVDYDGDYNLDEDDDWDEYANLDEDKYDCLDDDDEDEEDEEDEEDDLEAEDEDDKMLFKNKFRPFKHIMGPFKRQIKDDNSGIGHHRALLTPGHHHLIRRQTDIAGNNILKRTRSIFSYSYSETFSLKSKLFHFSLLRILDLSHVILQRFPPQILCLVWLRYLEFFIEYLTDFEIPPEICRLQNLQTFIVDECEGEFCFLPTEIWELTQLRHLKLSSFRLPNPPTVSADEQRYLEFSNIHTLSGLSHGCCTKEVISGIRNVRKLRVVRENDDYESFQESSLFGNLVHLHHLETLSVTISSDLQAYEPMTIPSAKAFPATLKKLKLFRTGLRWEDLNVIGELPNLEVLKLISDAEGKKWYPVAGGFTRLKILIIQNSDLKYWKVTNDSFPVLERLVIRGCTKLEEIPIEFVETISLQLIELKDCMPQLEASATRIQQEQVDIGNKPVDVRISKS